MQSATQVKDVLREIEKGDIVAVFEAPLDVASRFILIRRASYFELAIMLSAESWASTNAGESCLSCGVCGHQVDLTGLRLIYMEGVWREPLAQIIAAEYERTTHPRVEMLELDRRDVLELPDRHRLVYVDVVGEVY
ncbi:hypothetical protein HGA91_05425 [candidate division WWE3 bacterium]|nr:hypothetical protein [candidate division WWE3 bacterium]